MVSRVSKADEKTVRGRKNGHKWSHVSRLSTDNNVLGISIEDGNIVMAICRMNDKNGLYILSYQKVEYDEGREFLPSIAKIKQTLMNAFERLRRDCAAPVKYVLLGIPCWNLTSRDYSYEMNILPPFSKITQEHIQLLEKMLRKLYIPDNYIVVDCIPKSFIIDNNKKVRDPIGMVGERLRINAHLVITEIGVVESLLECLKELGIQVDALVSPFVAGLHGVLKSEEMELGVVLVDIGHLYTCCSFLFGGVLFDSQVLQVGGHYVSSSIAQSLRSSYKKIESAVESRRQAFLNEQSTSDIPVKMFGDSRVEQVPIKKMNNLIRLSTEQVLDLLFEGLNIAKGRIDFATAGIVLIGENYLVLKGILDVANNRVDIPFRLGLPQGVHGGDTFLTTDPAFSRLIGLIRYGVGKVSVPHYFLSKYYESIYVSIWRSYQEQLNKKIHKLVDKLI